ncbi:MAG: hypothetical protein WCT08_01825 [Patescibacteria group bacterium]|jgi:hypothetical protein
MNNFLFNFRRSKFEIQKIIKFSILSIFILLLAWIIEENIAFLGIHKIKVTNFLHIPRSVILTPGYEVGVFDSENGRVARPFGNKTEFKVTLPRGFKTINMQAEVQMDLNGTLAMGAKSVDSNSEQIIVNNPKILEDGWNIIPIEGGKLLTKKDSITTADQFFDNFLKFKKVVGIGPTPQNLIALPKIPIQTELINLAFPLRSDFSLNVYLDSNSKYIKLTKQDFNYIEGSDVVTITITKGSKKIISKTIPDDEVAFTGRNKPQDVYMELSGIQPSFYDIHFDFNNSDSMIRNLKLIGAEAKLSGDLVLGPISTPLSLLTSCKKIEVEAIKSSAFQEFIFGDKILNLQTAKKLAIIQTNSKNLLHKLQWHKGDVAIRSSCGFYLKELSSFGKEYQKYLAKLDTTTQLDSDNIKAIDAIIDTFDEVKTRKQFLIIDHTFELANLASKKNTFTFYLESPGLNTREGGYLYIKKLEFTAKRQAFSLGDIPKAFKAIFK